jgi:tellurite resistance protein
VADVAWYLEEIGKIAAKKELTDEAMNVEVVSSLMTIGITALEKQRGLTICQSTLSLAKLTILSEEIVKTMIQDYESKLEEQDREPFQKFEKLYEQELEKQRAER